MQEIKVSGRITWVGKTEDIRIASGAFIVRRYELTYDDTSKFKKAIIFTVVGEERIQKFNIQYGDNLEVWLDFKVSRTNRGMFTNITAWKIKPVDTNHQIAQSQQGNQQQQYQQPMNDKGNNNSPFPMPDDWDGYPSGDENDPPF